MHVKNKYYDSLSHMWLRVCPVCGDILASACELDLMPEFSICRCDCNGNKRPPFELFDRDGKTMIRRNKIPRFIGEVTLGQSSDIENIELIDECSDPMEMARVLRKAGEFLARQGRI